MKQREMTVYRARGTSIGTNNPLIMLQGKWLRDLGFSTGDRISVTCDGGRLIVEKTGRIWSDPKGAGMVAEDAEYQGSMKCFIGTSCRTVSPGMHTIRRWLTALGLTGIPDGMWNVFMTLRKIS